MTANTDFIAIIDNALSAELCQQIIQTFEKSEHLAPGRTGGGVDTSKKRSTDVSISRHSEFKDIYPQVASITGKYLVEYFKQYYFALIGPIGLTMADIKTGEPIKLSAENFDEQALPRLPQIVNYLFRIGEINAQKYVAGDGGYPYWHSENYPVQGSTEALHRNLLFMFYLNDVDEGGETEFYYQNKKVQPKAGRMVIAPSGFTHTHRGNIPVSNDKYILTSWVLFNPAEKIFAPI
ncbi:MAG: hypothetical protein ACI97K_001800 [Glaciecola sp.]|jgi:hypothetical protein